MVDSARQLLDELMGRNRNVDLALSIKQIDWMDTEYCQYYLVNFCPHDLFVNTRADLGACTKLHDDEAKRLFHEARPSIRKKQFEDEFLRFCSNMINECDRKIHKGKQRLLLMNKSAETVSPPISKHQEQINILNDRIKKLVNEAEEAGIRGDVDQAQGLMKLCDQLKEEKDALTSNKGQKDHWSLDFIQAQEKQMEVCEVCGAFLIIGDAQQRIDDHLTGKQHLGYSKLRKVVDEMYESRRKKRDEDTKKRDTDRPSHRPENGVEKYRGGGGGGGERYHRRREEFEDRRRNERGGGGGMERREYRGHRDNRQDFRFHDKTRNNERPIDSRESAHREQRYRANEERGSPKRSSRSRSRTH